MTLKEYCEIRYPTFKGIMDKFGFEEIELPDINERVFDYEINGIVVRVYSSIVEDTSRKCGEDAIRVCAIDPRTDTGLVRNKRINRIMTWRKNLIDRLEKTFEAIKQGKIQLAPRCPECNAIMILRKAKKGFYKGKEFWGCSRFPSCRGIINLEK